jgi:hypothetical protein
MQHSPSLKADRRQVGKKNSTPFMELEGLCYNKNRRPIEEYPKPAESTTSYLISYDIVPILITSFYLRPCLLQNFGVRFPKKIYEHEGDALIPRTKRMRNDLTFCADILCVTFIFEVPNAQRAVYWL